MMESQVNPAALLHSMSDKEHTAARDAKKILSF
jgi:hypothetical protein